MEEQTNQQTDESAKMQTDECQNNLAEENAPASRNQEVADLVKTRIDSYDMDGAVKELSEMINQLSEMYYQLKKVKYNYLVQTCELFARIDYPSIMLENCRQELGQVIPNPKDINGMNM